MSPFAFLLACQFNCFWYQHTSSSFALAQTHQIVTPSFWTVTVYLTEEQLQTEQVLLSST